MYCDVSKHCILLWLLFTARPDRQCMTSHCQPAVGGDWSVSTKVWQVTRVSETPSEWQTYYNQPTSVCPGVCTLYSISQPVIAWLALSHHIVHITSQFLLQLQQLPKKQQQQQPGQQWIADRQKDMKRIGAKQSMSGQAVRECQSKNKYLTSVQDKTRLVKDSPKPLSRPLYAMSLHPQRQVRVPRSILHCFN